MIMNICSYKLMMWIPKPWSFLGVGKGQGRFLPFLPLPCNPAGLENPTLEPPKKKKRVISVQDGRGCAGSNERQVENPRITEIALFTWPPFSKLVLEVKQLKLNEELGFQIAKNGNRETLEIKRSSYRSNSQKP
jgi:hypothetical protein